MDKEISGVRKIRAKISIERVIEGIKKVFGVSDKEIFERSRGGRKDARDATMWLLTRKFGIKNYEVGKVFGIGYSAVSHAGRRVEEEMKLSPEFAQKVEELIHAVQ
jgi:chromosomal replication initiation ATPase DnaA